MCDPIKLYYLRGYADKLAGKRNSPAIPQNFKLAYASGRYDAVRGLPSRYEKESEQ